MTLLLKLTDLVTAQTQGGSQGGEPGAFGGLVSILPIVLMFGVFYLLLIRPANKQRKEHQALLNALKKDDEVVTTGGIYGRIVSVDERVVALEIADKVKIRVLRERIAGRWAPGGAVKEATK
jgi:preprotein translocase subunit YajC